MNLVFHISEDGFEIKPGNFIKTGAIIPGEKVIARKRFHTKTFGLTN